MGVVGSRVEEQIGQGMAGEIFVMRQLLHKHKAGRINSPERRFAAKIVLDDLVACKQPEHAVLDRPQ